MKTLNNTEEGTQTLPKTISPIHTALELQRKKEKLLEEIRTLQNSIKKMDEDIQQNLYHVFHIAPTPETTGTEKIPRTHKTPKQHRRGPKPLSTCQRIENLLRKHPEGLRVPEIARAARKSESHIYNTMRKNGKKDHGIISLGQGRWGLNPKTPHAQTPTTP
jgi:predicted Zn-ribbon and HTH transcriptional regulator